MAKKPSAMKNGSKAGETKAAAAESPGIGHNGLTDEQLQALALQWKGQLEAATRVKDAAVSDLRNIRKKMKAELGADGVELVEDMIAVETEAGEAKIKARIDRAMRAARYMAVPLGSQFEMFEDRTPAKDRAAAEGRRDGAAGKSLKDCPYHPGTPQYVAYTESWHEGQAQLFSIQKKEDGEVFDKADVDKAASRVVGDAPATYQRTN